jgi:hypothetical protein
VPFELTWEPRGVYRRYFGRLSGHDLVASFSATHDDERFDRLRYNINDFLGVEGLTIQEDVLVHVAAVTHGAFVSNPKITVALVVTQPELIAALAQFQQLGGSPYALGVFETVAAARQFVAQDTG